MLYVNESLLSRKRIDGEEDLIERFPYVKSNEGSTKKVYFLYFPNHSRKNSYRVLGQISRALKKNWISIFAFSKESDP